jgi:hypothetical protein
MVPRDTTPDAWVRHIDALRAMGPDARLRLAAEASDDIRQLARDGMRHRHPDWDDTQLQDAFETMMLGEDAARTARRVRLAARR